jgi:hypothetical protein
MKIDLKQHITDLKGRPLMTARIAASGKVMLDALGRPEVEPETLGSTLADALVSMKGAEDMSTKVKLKAYALATKIVDAESYEFSTDEIELVKSRVEVACGQLAVGRIFEIFTPVGGLSPSEQA